MGKVDHALWQKIIQHVIASGGNVIRPWFTELEPIALEHGLLEIATPGPAELRYCRDHATDLFTRAAQAATGRLIGVCFLTRADARSDHDETPDGPEAFDAVKLDEDYSFDSFVTGPCNRLAHAACLAVSGSAGKTYNPLFIHGCVGLGKTHLLQATAGKIKADRNDARIVLLSCEMFVNHFIESVERGELHDFRYRYRHSDVLVIDDVQFLSDHEQTQEEFFHTFNTLYQTQKQIILSSDRSPDEIPGLEERLVSRFNWGLVAQIGRPCYETRVAIVHKKARIRGIKLPDDVACFIAATIDSNTRELEGAIAKVAMLAQVSERDIDLPLAEEALGALPDPSAQHVTIEDILRIVTHHYRVRLADLQSKKRSRSIALPRQVCMYLARNLTPHSLEEIGGYFGGRDHTTVLHAKRSIEAACKKDPHFQASIDHLAQQVQSA
ncbi:MAG: chromosomal replication initiator protein DnaA [Phycisphaerae bacterium]|nr:chromosomal replication initiator protein DnaA [Phycisphaerae bacterium]